MVDKDYVCEDWGETTQWTQIRVTVHLADLDRLMIDKDAVEYREDGTILLK